MRALRVLIALAALTLAIPMTTAVAGNALPANGTISICPGYPQPPFAVEVQGDGTIFTAANVCKVWAGTVQGTAVGIQYTTIYPDTSRTFEGTETLVGTVAGIGGTADFNFEGSRPCFPGCSGTIYITSQDGTGGLENLELNVTATGSGSFTYIGSYSLG